MSYSIILTDAFKKEARKLIKRYASLARELQELGTELEKNPTKGTPLGNDVYKIRLSIKSKNKGKSGGARIISCVKVIKEKVYLLTIYSKGERDTVTVNEIEQMLKNEGLQ
jgi:mRNA-degrading endonuclease RelE of RelBE toxin-antitoxin system